MAYDKRRRHYELGEPVQFTADAVRQISLTGTRGKTLTVNFLLELDGRKRDIDMDLTPFCFRKNSFYPFDLMQETACDRALKVAENMARIACNLTPEELEAGRLKEECSQYGTYAACAGIFGVLLTPANNLPIVLACFAISLLLFGRMIAKKQIPKISAIVVLIEAVGAYLLMQ